MLPTRLELRNFLAYRNPDPILFEDMHLACLSGRNGAGKSSLLDAITWALWGKARARSDDDLIHLGQAEMQVMLDFLHGEQHYRVIRKRKPGKLRSAGGRAPGQSTLDFFGWDEDTQVFRLISEPSMRETQERINNMLRLDYEIFAASAFLQQGKADAFTTKTPAQRKEILSDILGLERWSRYEEKTREKLKDIQQEAVMLAERIAEMEREIAEEPSLLRELADAEALLAEADERVSLAENSLQEVQGADIELRGVEQALASVQYNIEQREKDISTLNAEITRLEERLALFEGVVSDEKSIQEGYAQLEQARLADKELGSKLSQLNDLNQHIAMLEKQLYEARQEIELEVRELETLIQTDQEAVSTGRAVETILQELDSQIAELEQLEAERETYQDQISRLNEESAALRTKNDTLHKEMNEIKNRLDLLEKSIAPECPICNQPLNEQQKQNLIAQMTHDGTLRGDEYRANITRMEEIKEAIKQLQNQFQDASKLLKELPRLRGQRGGYEQQMKTAQEAEDRIHNNEINLHELQRILNEERFAEAIREQFESAYTERDNLGYDADEHNTVRENMELFLGYQDKAKDLEFAKNSIPDIQQSLENTRKSLERNEKSLQEYTQQIDNHNQERDRLEIKVAEMKLRQDEVNKQRTLQRTAQEKVINVKQSLKAIAKMRERRIEMIERRTDLDVEENIYDQLKNAFGRNGVPAMIIDAAIPELEEAANRLLSRMTNNRMNLQFSTQREKKTGGIAETLDIWIQDELGQRDYSLFSGGEAFRVNFAIRVALSQMLARRAGAQLRTLFIDEGFGTQDDAGRERLIEAINTIQEDFDLILVITHIEELKDAFPAHIEVTKTPNGSLAVVR